MAPRHAQVSIFLPAYCKTGVSYFGWQHTADLLVIHFCRQPGPRHFCDEPVLSQFCGVSVLSHFCNEVVLSHFCNSSTLSRFCNQFALHRLPFLVMSVLFWTITVMSLLWATLGSKQCLFLFEDNSLRLLFSLFFPLIPLLVCVAEICDGQEKSVLSWATGFFY